jgi:hypothetical protein
MPHACLARLAFLLTHVYHNGCALVHSASTVWPPCQSISCPPLGHWCVDNTSAPCDLHVRPSAPLSRATTATLASAYQHACTLLAAPSATKRYMPRASTPYTRPLCPCEHGYKVPPPPSTYCLPHHRCSISGKLRHHPLLFLAAAAIAHHTGCPFLPVSRSRSIASPWICSRN